MPTHPEFRVDFLIGGAQKGGTTALARFLSQHPEICAPRWKEPHFFDAPDFPERAGFAEVNRRYRDYFPRELRGRVVGEATPVYMYLPEVPARVRAYNPAMKWILLLREPVSRALSHYQMQRERGWEWLPLAWALRAERWRCWRDRRRRAWKTALRRHSYVERGFYSEQLERLYRLFPREQVLVLTSEELRRAHAATLARVYAFLELTDQACLPPAEEVFAGRAAPAVAPRTRAWLRARYAAEIPRLERLLGRALPEWRDPGVGVDLHPPAALPGRSAPPG